MIGSSPDPACPSAVSARPFDLMNGTGKTRLPKVENCMRTVLDEAALLTLLRRCRDLVAQSEDSVWSCMSAKDILKSLDDSIHRLERSSTVEIDQLRFLFVVTGPLQETSMSNGWAEEFIVLAERFDGMIGE